MYDVNRRDTVNQLTIKYLEDEYGGEHKYDYYNEMYYAIDIDGSRDYDYHNLNDHILDNPMELTTLALHKATQIMNNHRYTLPGS